ncbi:MAG: glycosyltransferase family 1 protein [Lysobacteraceae bacterium]
MRIEIVSETWPPEVNGVALTVHGLCQGLRVLGHQVGVVRPRQADEAAPDADTLLAHSAPLPRYPGLRFGLPAGRQILGRWRARRPQAVYIATEGPLGWSALRAARRLGIPVATGFHTRFDEYMARYGAGALSPLAFAWLRRFHNQGQATLTPTRELADFLTRRGFRQVAQLGRAVDTRLFDPARRSATLRAQWGLDNDELGVIHVGRLAAEKNLDLLFRAFDAIRRQRPGARLIIVGDGPGRAALAAAHPHAVFTGIQRDVELARHFVSGDLFLFPSLSETFGNVTLEAMASGLASVAFDYGAAREHLRDGEHGHAPARKDEAAFIAAALRLASDDAARRRMGAAARQAVSGLHPLDVSRRFADLLSSLSIKEHAA